MARTEEGNSALTPIEVSSNSRANLMATIAGVSIAGSSQPYSAPPSATSLSPRALLAALRRRLWLALGLGLFLASIAATLIWLFLPPPKPRVSAKMYMTWSHKGTLFEHPDPQISQQTQMALIRSQLVLTAALAQPDIRSLALVSQQAQPQEWLAKELLIDYPNGGEIIRLSLLTTEIDDGMKVVNAVKSAYLEEIVNESINSRKERLGRLKALQERSQENLKRKQAVVRKLAENVGSTKPENVAIQQQLIQEQFATAQRELIKIQSDLRRMTTEEAGLKNGTPVASSASEIAVRDAIEAAPAVKELLRRQTQIESNLKDAERVLSKPLAEAARERAKTDLATIARELEAAQKVARENFTAAQSSRKELDGQTRLTNLREQIAYTKDLNKVLETEVERLGKSIKFINTANLDLEAEKIEIAIAEELYAKIAGAISTLSAEQDAPPRVRSLEDASVERVNADARKIQMSGLGGVGVFGLVCFVVALFEYRHHRIETPDAVGRLCNLNVLGTVPWIPQHLERKSIEDQHYWHSILSESMACTQSYIRHLGNSPGPKILLVTSAEKGEGKTTFSTQLAMSFARNGMKTLLIDGDIRQPSAHHCFQSPSSPGLCEVIRGEMDDRAAMREVQPNLTFLPAGRYSEGAVLALAMGTGLADLSRFKALYGIVIVDSSPLMLVSDAMHLSKQADGVLVAVLTGKSRENLVREAVARLRQIAAPLLGIVVNGFSFGGYAYGYNYGYNRTPPDALGGQAKLPSPPADGPK